MNKEAAINKMKQMRKIAFVLGFMRFCHEANTPEVLQVLGDSGRLQKIAKIQDDEDEGQVKVANTLQTLLLAAVVPAVGSYYGGRALGQAAGNLYGLGTDISKDTVRENEYALASAATDQLIREMEARRHNQAIRDVLGQGQRQIQHPGVWTR